MTRENCLKKLEEVRNKYTMYTNTDIGKFISLNSNWETLLSEKPYCLKI